MIQENWQFIIKKPAIIMSNLEKVKPEPVDCNKDLINNHEEFSMLEYG